MNKIYFDPLGASRSRDEQPCFFIDYETGILSYQKSYDTDPQLVTRQAAEEIIKGLGYYQVYGLNWSILEGFDKRRQEVYDFTNEIVDEIEEGIEICSKIGIDIDCYIERDIVYRDDSKKLLIDMKNGKIAVSVIENDDPEGIAQIAIPKD